ncbi:MAG: transporter, partial [Phyllobacteriaceae bacterium]|nr:transporter [Phyllobacteriaceae bacterium]
MKASKKNWLMVCVAGLAVSATAADAFAAGFMLREQSSEYLGNSYAGSAAKAQSPATIWY